MLVKIIPIIVHFSKICVGYERHSRENLVEGQILFDAWRRKVKHRERMIERLVNVQNEKRNDDKIMQMLSVVEELKLPFL